LHKGFRLTMLFFGGKEAPGGEVFVKTSVERALIDGLFQAPGLGDTQSVQPEKNKLFRGTGEKPHDSNRGTCKKTKATRIAMVSKRRDLVKNNLKKKRIHTSL